MSSWSSKEDQSCDQAEQDKVEKDKDKDEKVEWHNDKVEKHKDKPAASSSAGWSGNGLNRNGWSGNGWSSASATSWNGSGWSSASSPSWNGTAGAVGNGWHGNGWSSASSPSGNHWNQHSAGAEGADDAADDAKGFGMSSERKNSVGNSKLVPRKSCAHGVPKDTGLHKDRDEISLDRLQSDVPDVSKSNKEVTEEEFWQAVSAYIPIAAQGTLEEWRDKNEELLRTTRFFKHSPDRKPAACFVWWACTNCGVSVKLDAYTLTNKRQMERFEVVLQEYFLFKALRQHSNPRCTPATCKEQGRHIENFASMTFSPRTYAAIREQMTTDVNYPQAHEMSGFALAQSLNGRHPDTVEYDIDLEKRKTIRWFHNGGKGKEWREVYAVCMKCDAW